jgi:hypothetical protein
LASVSSRLNCAFDFDVYGDGDGENFLHQNAM